MSASYFDQLGKRVRVVDRDFRQALAVESNVGVLQGSDELAVADPAQTAGGMDAHDPQPAKLPFADAPVPEGVDPRPDEGHDGLAIEVVPAHDETLGEPAQTFAATKHRFAAACTNHVNSLQRGTGNLSAKPRLLRPLPEYTWWPCARWPRPPRASGACACRICGSKGVSCRPDAVSTCRWP